MAVTLKTQVSSCQTSLQSIPGFLAAPVVIVPILVSVLILDWGKASIRQTWDSR